MLEVRSVKELMCATCDRKDLKSLVNFHDHFFCTVCQRRISRKFIRSIRRKLRRIIEARRERYRLIAAHEISEGFGKRLVAVSSTAECLRLDL